MVKQFFVFSLLDPQLHCIRDSSMNLVHEPNAWVEWQSRWWNRFLSISVYQKFYLPRKQTHWKFQKYHFVFHELVPDLGLWICVHCSKRRASGRLSLASSGLCLGSASSLRTFWQCLRHTSLFLLICNNVNKFSPNCCWL